jgi:hypothetical protein
MVTQRAKPKSRQPARTSEKKPVSLAELAAHVRATVPSKEWKKMPVDYASRLDEYLESPGAIS